MAKCWYCGAKITRKSPILHINRTQEIQVKAFCNRNCKMNWIDHKSLKEHRKAIVGGTK